MLDHAIYKHTYKTPSNFDDLVLVSDGVFLTGLWFANSKGAVNYARAGKERELPVFEETIRWLDIYFGGRDPDFTPQYKITNPTPFRTEVSNIMKAIPFGKTTTYKDIATNIAKRHGIKKMSSQAVGSAVGWNPICIIIPCHRVIGSNGNLTGYGGGLKNKIALLAQECHDVNQYTLPKRNMSP